MQKRTIHLNMNNPCMFTRINKYSSIYIYIHIYTFVFVLDLGLHVFACLSFHYYPSASLYPTASPAQKVKGLAKFQLTILPSKVEGHGS